MFLIFYYNNGIDGFSAEWKANYYIGYLDNI